MTAKADTLEPPEIPEHTAIASGKSEAHVVGPYTGTYGAQVAAVDCNSARCGPGPSSYALQIVSAGKQKSGIQHESRKFQLDAGQMYELSCWVFASEPVAAFRLGVKSDAAGHLWAADTSTGMIDFSVGAGAWTELRGRFRVPDNGAGPAQLWILCWVNQDLTWFLDEVSLVPANEETVAPVHDIQSWDPLNAAERNLLVCRPFQPDRRTDLSPLSFLFVDENAMDPEQIALAGENYTQVYIESCLADRFSAADSDLPLGFTRVDDILDETDIDGASPRVLFLASNDTHAQFMMRLEQSFDETLFVIPDPIRKNEGAAARLDERGVAYEKIDYNVDRHDAIEAFRPDVALCGADWTSEFISLQSVARQMNVPCIALQEGPQDWWMTVNGVDPRKYRRADILLAQGAVTLKYIRPRYVSVTGNPKTDRVEPEPLPPQPKVFINCNFTYGQYEEHRSRWLDDIVRTCCELNLDYLISQHPRDTAEIDDPNRVASSAFCVRKQIAECSIGVSRFSNLSYEFLTMGRTSIYYNPHGELPRTFNEEPTSGIFRATTRKQLRAALAAHKANPKFDREAARLTMTRHCGTLDGNSLGRIRSVIRSVSANRQLDENAFDALCSRAAAEEERLDFSVIVCTHNRATCLRRCLDSVLEDDTGDITFEVVLVDNASTDVTRGLSYSYHANPRFRYIYEPELGLSRARNTGIRAARGRHVIFLDDDGEVCKGWLQSHARVVNEHPDALAIGGRIEVQFERPKPWWITGISLRFYGDYDLGSKIQPAEWVPGGNAVWNRDELLKLGGFNPELGRTGATPLLGSEESEVLARAKKNGQALYYAPDPVMVHHISKSRMTVRYLATRHLGQGVTAFRWERILNGMTPERARDKIRHARRGRLKSAVLALSTAITGRLPRASEHAFNAIRHHGYAREARRYLEDPSNRDGKP